MFGEMPNIFGRKFAVGFFLPMVIFFALSLVLLESFGTARNLVLFFQGDILVKISLLGLLSWMGGVLLLALNRDLYRLLEGYGKFNPLRLIGWIQRRQYSKLQKSIELLDDEYLSYQNAGKAIPADVRNRRNAAMKRLAENFPDEERWLLPTAFGNTLRAFEVYPRVMYGMETIYLWNRLLTVIPSDYREMIEDAKSQVDFWLNLTILSLLLIIQYFCLAISVGTFPTLWIIMVFLLILLVAPSRARQNAVEWGDLVKSAFDVYHFDLIDAIGIDKPLNRNIEKELWMKYSQSIIYRLPSVMPKLRNIEKSRTRDILNKK